MARVLALVPDLLFGSQVQGMLVAGGNEVELLAGEERLRKRLEEPQEPFDVLIVDLTNADLNGAGLLESLTAAGRLKGIGTLAFYSHVDVEVRERAERAGFQMVVPRSRMAREGAQLVTNLLPAG